MPRIHSRELRDAVSDLLGTGLSDYEIARRTGVRRATVQRWRRRGIPVDRVPTEIELHPEAWQSEQRRGYAYLLGLYLGDGVVSRHGATFSLMIACDGLHPVLIEECREAVSRFAARPPSVLPVRESRCVRVTSYGQHWPLLFPQHGPGKKHERKIELAGWQREIVDEHPRELLRGMIHSDGSRCQNTFTIELKGGPKEYTYPRYFFTNYSADIRAIFCAACDRLGIRWSRSSWRNISVSHRGSVALLDEFIGPKT